MSLVFSVPPKKHQKNSGFLMFPGILERDQWYEMITNHKRKMNALFKLFQAFQFIFYNRLQVCKINLMPLLFIQR